MIRWENKGLCKCKKCNGEFVRVLVEGRVMSCPFCNEEITGEPDIIGEDESPKLGIIGFSC